MTLSISPGEFHVLSDRYVIKTKCPVDKITDDMLTLRVRNANLSVGDGVTVQCFNHGLDTLLFEADYRVYQRSEALRTHEVNDREIRQINEVTYGLARVGEWWASPAAPDVRPQVPENAVAADIRWNLGRQAHEVFDILSGAVIASFTKEQGGKEAAEAFIDANAVRGKAA